jgi:hypothetical protein
MEDDTMVHALLVSPDGNVKMVQYEGYLGMKALLDGGYIESVRFGPTCIAMCDEDGKQKGLRKNEKAIMLAQLVGTPLGKHDYFVGPVLIVGPVNQYGDETDIPPEMLLTISRILSVNPIDVEK